MTTARDQCSAVVDRAAGLVPKQVRIKVGDPKCSGTLDHQPLADLQFSERKVARGRIEKEIHDYEGRCKAVECNTVGEGYDPLLCPVVGSSSSSPDVALAVALPIAAVLVITGIAGAVISYRKGAEYAQLKNEGKAASGNPTFAGAGGSEV